MAKRFLTPPQLPSGSSLPSSGAAGDLFFKSDESKIYVHDGTEWVVAQGSGGGGGVVVSDTAPADPTEGTYWFDSTTAKSYIYYDSYWVEVSGAGIGYMVSETAPSNPSEGDVWFSTAEGVIYVYYDSYWVDPSTGGAAGVPAGGLEGQIIAKTTDADYDVQWIDNYTGDLRIICKNDSGVEITKGNAVMAVGATGDQIKIAKAVADGSVEPRYMLGIAMETISNGASGYVAMMGTLTNIDTTVYGVVGTVLYIDPDTPGALTTTQPTAPDLDMAIAIVTRYHAETGRVFIRMWAQQQGLHELHDVAISSATTGDILTYDGTTWVNATIDFVTTDYQKPENPNAGDLWFDQTSGILSIFHDDNVTYLTNYVVNPKMDVNTFGWSGFSGSETVSYGTLSQYNTTPAVVATIPYNSEFQTYGLSTTVTGLEVGRTYYFSAWIGYDNDDDALFSSCTVKYDIDGLEKTAAIRTPGSASPAPPSYFRATDTEHTFSIKISAPGGSLAVSYALFSEGSSYYDGDSTDWHWNGTPYQSTSTQDGSGDSSKQWVQVFGAHSFAYEETRDLNFPINVEDGTQYGEYIWSEAKQRWSIAETAPISSFGQVTARSEDWSIYENIYSGYPGDAFSIIAGSGITISADSNSKEITLSPDLTVVAPLTQAVNAKTANYTLTADDRGEFITADGTFTITLPASVFSAGDRVDFVNIGTGVITFAAGSGFTLNSADGAVTIDTQWAGATVFFTSATTGVLIGKLA